MKVASGYLRWESTRHSQKILAEWIKANFMGRENTREGTKGPLRHKIRRHTFIKESKNCGIEGGHYKRTLLTSADMLFQNKLKIFIYSSGAVWVDFAAFKTNYEDCSYSCTCR